MHITFVYTRKTQQNKLINYLKNFLALRVLLPPNQQKEDVDQACSEIKILKSVHIFKFINSDSQNVLVKIMIFVKCVHILDLLIFSTFVRSFEHLLDLSHLLALLILLIFSHLLDLFILEESCLFRDESTELRIQVNLSNTAQLENSITRNWFSLALHHLSWLIGNEKFLLNKIFR